MFSNFRDFLLINEHKHYLGQRAGDILSAIQNLEEDAPNLGNRAVMRAAEGIVNQIRRILKGRWDDSDLQYLKRLQKVGVAIMKSIEEKENMESVIAGAAAEVESMIQDLEVPINTVGADKDMIDSPDDDSPAPIQQGTQLKA